VWGVAYLNWVGPGGKFSYGYFRIGGNWFFNLALTFFNRTWEELGTGVITGAFLVKSRVGDSPREFGPFKQTTGETLLLLGSRA